MAYYRSEQHGIAVYTDGGMLVKICRFIEDARALCGRLIKEGK